MSPFSTREHLAMSEDIFYVSDWGEDGCCWYPASRGQDAGKQDIAPHRKELLGPKFSSAEVEKLLSMYLVTNRLKVTLSFFGRQAYVRISNNGVRIHHFGSSKLHNNPNWLNAIPWCHSDTSPTLHGFFTEYWTSMGSKRGYFLSYKQNGTPSQLLLSAFYFFYYFILFFY